MTGRSPAVRVVWDPRFLEYDFGPGHPFTEKSRASAVGLFEQTLAPDEPDAVEWVREVPVASDEVLGRFHVAEYLETVRAAAVAPSPRFLDRGDTPSFLGCFDASARLVGGTVSALEGTRRDAVPGFAPGGGFHHAAPDRASGFCIFNDVAVAVATALANNRRTAYLDLDAHHGDGVMYGFYRDGRLLDIDFHQDGRTLFPGTGAVDEIGAGDGAGRKVNVPLPPGSGDEALVPLAERLLPPLLREHRPELIVLQHGVDGHVGDPLARLAYTSDGYAQVDRLVVRLAGEVGAGLVVTGGGGYRAASVSRVLARVARLAAGFPLDEPEGALPERWRHEFAAAFHTPAPTTWSEPHPVGRRPSSARLEGSCTPSS